MWPVIVIVTYKYYLIIYIPTSMSKLNDYDIEYILYDIPSSGEIESESDISSNDDSDQDKT